MFGPGVYRPDPTEGITTIADLPPPEIVPLVAMTSGNHVHAVGTQPIGTSRPSGRCTTRAISTCGVRVIS